MFEIIFVELFREVEWCCGDICKACEKDGWYSSQLILSLTLLPIWSTYSPPDFNPLFSQLFKNLNHSLSTFSTNFNTFVRSSMNCKKVVTFLVPNYSCQKNWSCASALVAVKFSSWNYLALPLFHFSVCLLRSKWFQSIWKLIVSKGFFCQV